MKSIVNLSTRQYTNGQNRLRESLRGKTDADLFFYTQEAQVGAPLHKNNSHSFKTYACLKAIEAGYDEILWLDASIYAIKPLEKIWNIIKRNGIFCEDSGNWCGNWCNDRSLDYMGYTREEAMAIPMFSSGVTGFSLKHEKGAEFFRLWHKASMDGMFSAIKDSTDPNFIDHRHDQSLASLIVHKFGMKVQPGTTYLEYKAPGNPPRNNSIIFFANGIN